MEADELQLLLKIREGIINTSWEEVVNAWNEISGEELEVPDTRTHAEKLKQQIQEQILQDDIREEIQPKKKTNNKSSRKKKTEEEDDIEEEPLKDEDIVKIEDSNDDNKGSKKNTRGVQKRSSGIPDSMKADSEEGKDKPTRFHDKMPEHIPRGSE